MSFKRLNVLTCDVCGTDIIWRDDVSIGRLTDGTFHLTRYSPSVEWDICSLRCLRVLAPYAGMSTIKGASEKE